MREADVGLAPARPHRDSQDVNSSSLIRLGNAISSIDRVGRVCPASRCQRARRSERVTLRRVHQDHRGEQVGARRDRLPGDAHRLPRHDDGPVQPCSRDHRNEILGPLLVRTARPVGHRVRQAHTALVEHHQTTERSETGLEARGDPILGQQLEREERSGDHDHVDASRLADHSVRDVGVVGLGPRDVAHLGIVASGEGRSRGALSGRTVPGHLGGRPGGHHGAPFRGMAGIAVPSGRTPMTRHSRRLRPHCRPALRREDHDS